MEITFAELHGYPVVRAVGDLTRAASSRLKEAVERVAAEHPPGLLCDLRRLGPVHEGLPNFQVVLDGLPTWSTGPLVLLVGDAGLRDHLDGLRMARRADVVSGVGAALTALRTPPAYGRASVGLPVGEDAVALAEEFVASVLTAWEAVLCLDPARLVTGELVRNAVVHAGGEIRLHVSADSAAVTVSVADRGADTAVPRPRDGGIGLPLVEQVADRWGVLPRSGGGHLVWARLRRRRAEPAVPCLP